MTTKITETVWLNAADVCSLEHMIDVSGLSRQDVLDLIDAGVLEPFNHEHGDYSFHTDCIVVARKARRLRDDFELDTKGLTLTMRLLRRVDGLQAEITSLRARLLVRRS